MVFESSQDHRRSSCDELLATPNIEVEFGSELADPEGLLGQSQIEDDDPEMLSIQRQRPSLSLAALRRRAFFVRALALLCACSLSVGSHYASNILGPLKSRLSRELGTSHTEFSLLISAFTLNSTWTPLVGGILASTLGTTFTSILATGIILLGQVLLLLGDIWQNVRLMVLGLFVFGLGVSPLAVVQETIIVRFFKSHGLGVSMAFGLIAGKGASFVSAITSYPLTERFGSRAPFYVATALAALSVIVNLIYIASSKWLVDGAGAELEAPDISEEARKRMSSNISEAQALEKVAAKRRVNLKEVTMLGDIFWAYIALNVLYGMIWSPFTHLAANIIQTRYNLSEELAATQASYLLAGSIFLYPVCGFVVDRYKHRPIVVQLLLLSSVLTTFSYAWFALPSSLTGTPLPAIFSFAVGHGFAPLLLVVIVPKIVPLKFVSTALGVHKSLEQTGSTLFQTFAGLALDAKRMGSKPSDSAVQHLLNVFLSVNIIQLCSVVFLALLQRHKDARAASTRPRSESPHASNSHPSQFSQTSTNKTADSTQCRSESMDIERPLLENYSEPQTSSSMPTVHGSRRLRFKDEVFSKEEVRRGKFFALISGFLVVFAWLVFMGTAWLKLGTKGHS